MVADLGSQTEVARRTGLSASYVSKIVREEADPQAVKLATIDTVASHLGLDDEWLFSDSWDPKGWREHSLTRLGARAADGAAQRRYEERFGKGRRPKREA